MREEASLESWRELYEITQKLGQMEPWKDLCDSQLIGIYLKDTPEPVFCSILGNAGSCYGFCVYEGYDGLGDFDMIATAHEYGLPLDYVMFEQSSLCCYWGDREETSAQHRKVIKELELKFRGKGKWIYFNSYKARYSPYIPDTREVRVLTEAFTNLAEVICDIREGKLWADFDHGELLWRKYDTETKQYVNWAEGLKEPPQKSYPCVMLHDDILKKKLKDQPYNDAEIMVDFVYLNTEIRDKNYDRPLNPLLFIAFDAQEEQIITIKLLDVDEREVDLLMNFFVSFVEQFGKMPLIRARNPWVFATLENICEYCGVQLENDTLWELDQIIEEIKDQMF